MTPQSTFMITAVIRPGEEAVLGNLLQTMNQAPGLADPANDLVPFGQLKQLHVARFTVLRALTNDDIRVYYSYFCFNPECCFFFKPFKPGFG